jgi:PAS domain S-box-containing protein
MANKNSTTSDNQKEINSLARKLKACQNKVQKYERLIQDLENEKDMFRAFLKTAPDNIYFKDRKSRITLISKAMDQWFSAKGHHDVIGKTDFDIFTDEHAQEAFDDEQELMGSGIPLINKEEKETWEDGTITWVSTSKVPIKGANGRVSGMVGISRDITDKKEAESKLQRYQEILEKAKAETDNILASVKEGLFLLNKDLKIGSQYSKELLNIFKEKKLANRNFINILKNKISKDNFDATKHYLELLFNNMHDEEMLGDLNPLQEVEVRIGPHNKFLTFNFRRIKQRGDNISELMVTVVDVTKQVNLQQSLQEQRNENKRKMDWILSIFNTDPHMLKEFISSVQDEMVVVEEALKILGEKDKHLDLLDGIYRSLHTIKGNASLLELDTFADQAHRAEDTVHVIKNKMKLIGKDKTDLKLQIDNIHKTFDEFKGLIDQMGNIHEKFRPKRSHEQNQLIKSLNRLVESLASKYDKKIKLDVSDFDGTAIPYKHRLLLRDVLIQMLRNAVYHGIEKPAQRKKIKKPEIGHILITGRRENGAYKLEFKDDGQGLDLDRIKKSISDNGKWTLAEINQWSQNRLAKAIFLPHISTAVSTDMTAGRGIGMDVIQTKLKQIDGKISVSSNPGNYTRFVITLPV